MDAGTLPPTGTAAPGSSPIQPATDTSGVLNSTGEAAPAAKEPLPSDQEVMDYLAKLVSNTAAGNSYSGLESYMPKLRRWRDQVVPILEGWLHRSEELHVEGVRLTWIMLAYAELAGPEAVPLLRKLNEGPYRWNVATALTRNDSPEAMDLLEELIRDAAAQDISAVGASGMWRGSAHCRDLLRKLAAERPDMRSGFANTLFQRGTEEDRERLWNASLAGPEPMDLYSSIRPEWGEKWRERYLTAVRSHLNSSVANRRYGALYQFAAYPERFGPDGAEQGLEAIEREIKNWPPDEPHLKRLNELRKTIQSKQAEQAKDQRLREVLGE